MENRLVLVVEGDDHIANSLAATLRDAEYEVVVSTTASAGLAAAVEIRPDCVLCDLDLPDEDGYWLARNLRALPPPASLPPLVFLSAYSDASVRVEGFRAGGDAFIQKPMRVDEIIAQVDAMTELAWRLRKRNEASQSMPPEAQYGMTAVEGDVRMMSSATILSILGMERRTGVFEIISKKRHSQIEIAEGFVVQGAIGGSRADPLQVLRLMLSWTVGRFSFTPLPPFELPTSQYTVQALLLDAAKAEDEAAAGMPGSVRLFDGDAPPAVAGPPSRPGDTAPPSSRTMIERASASMSIQFDLIAPPPASKPPASKPPASKPPASKSPASKSSKLKDATPKPPPSRRKKGGASKASKAKHEPMMDLDSGWDAVAPAPPAKAKSTPHKTGKRNRLSSARMPAEDAIVSVELDELIVEDGISVQLDDLAIRAGEAREASINSSIEDLNPRSSLVEPPPSVHPASLESVTPSSGKPPSSVSIDDVNPRLSSPRAAVENVRPRAGELGAASLSVLIEDIEDGSVDRLLIEETPVVPKAIVPERMPIDVTPPAGTRLPWIRRTNAIHPPAPPQVSSTASTAGKSPKAPPTVPNAPRPSPRPSPTGTRRGASRPHHKK